MPELPNIILILSDDTDPGYLGCYGGQYLTPHLDALAQDGIQMMQSHVATPICCPSRYTYFTGKYACRGIRHADGQHPEDRITEVGFNAEIHPGENHLATLLRNHGYATGFTGKCHMGRGKEVVGARNLPGDGDPTSPEVDACMRENEAKYIEELKGLGFDYAASVTWGNVDQGVPPAAWIHNQEWITKGALEFLDQYAQHSQPYFLHMATNVIHGPEHAENILDLDPSLCYAGQLEDDPSGVQPSRQSIIERLKEHGLPVSHRTVGMLWLDDAIGALVKKLKDMGEYDNTLIIYSADHGVEGKWSTHSSGTHVPCIWKLPGSAQAGHRAHPHVQNCDVLPTLADMLALELPDNYTCDGVSYLPILRGSQSPSRDDLYFEFGTQRAVQTQRWKFISTRYQPEAIESMGAGHSTAIDFMNRTGICRVHKMHPDCWDPDQLYDRHRDPGERMNMVRWPNNEMVVADMKARLKKYTDRLNPAFPDEPHEFQHSGMYRSLCRAASAIDLCNLPGQPWYTEGWY